MNPIAAIFDCFVLYRYSLVLALACAAGICFFMACCGYLNIPTHRAATVTLAAVLLSLFLSRLVYWYGRPDSFSTFFQVLTDLTTESLALTGAFIGCVLAAVAAGGSGYREKILDCMSVAGSFALCLGRLGSFFTETDRGQIMTRLTALPWAYPVTNISGHPEYRFATFLFQSAAAGLLGIILAVVFFRKKSPHGHVSILFVLCYSASQIILDSTRYDSLYLRSNGFVSIVQVFAAAVLVVILVLLSIRMVKIRGLRNWMFPLWIALLALLGGTGYMEYYVQRHGREAAFSYSVMGACLLCIVCLGILLLRLSERPQKQ